MTFVRARFRAMASLHEIVLDARDETCAQRAIDAAVAEVRRIEAKYSRYRDDSVASAINAAAGRGAVAIDAETSALLAYADRCFALSGGRFDLTSGALRRAWDFRREPPVLPSQRAVDALLAHVGWDRVEWNADSVRLPSPGMELDFGGIGKEYAADRAATILHDLGERHGFVNLGGDVRIVGPRVDSAPWRIGIVDPRAPADDPDRPVAFVEMREGALATSGDYERFFELDSRRYCHLLDARSGWPVDHWRSISVAASLCTVAGSCSTIGMLLGPAAAGFMAEQQVQWFGIDAHGVLHGTLPTTRDP
jgi:thiamine biosynthesis lipoprotein